MCFSSTVVCVGYSRTQWAFNTAARTVHV